MLFMYTGGRLFVNCKSSNFETIVVMIECPTILAFVNYSTSEQRNEFHLFVNHQKFVENCNVKCGQDVQHFVVNGTIGNIQHTGQQIRQLPGTNIF
ncbi:hypothetical protein CRE_24313 [Caenorhabditis remanei]|uniref:Uncharacterized protein n=1 Tax=Caenorhabditis remanei TaxID=31234 RepID=E3NPN6_CAERE|nr:hypothetical protein CRE_24313 [Caenorhabditis remanei]